MIRAYIFLTVFVVTIDLGLFIPTPVDDLTINLNLNESPKGYEEDAFNNNDYQAPSVYSPTIKNNYVETLLCSVVLKDGKILESIFLSPNQMWSSAKPVNRATTEILCTYLDQHQVKSCDRFLNPSGTTNRHWVVIASGGQNPCKVEKEPIPYKPTIENKLVQGVTCSVALKGGKTVEYMPIPPGIKAISPEPVDRLTTLVLCQFGGIGCDTFYDFYGTTNPDWMVTPSGGENPCKVEKAPILYEPTAVNNIALDVFCSITLKSGIILPSPAIPPNQKWNSLQQVHEETTLVECTFAGGECEQYIDDRGTKNADWVVNESSIDYLCKVERAPTL